MYISASAPDAPPFSDTTIGCFIRLFFWIAACIIRAIWSEAPPATAATTISTGLVGSQPASAGALASMAASTAAIFVKQHMYFVLMRSSPRAAHIPVGRVPYAPHCAELCRSVQAGRQPTGYDFGLRQQAKRRTPAIDATCL